MPFKAEVSLSRPILPFDVLIEPVKEIMGIVAVWTVPIPEDIAALEEPTELDRIKQSNENQQRQAAGQRPSGLAEVWKIHQKRVRMYERLKNRSGTLTADVTPMWLADP